MPIDIALIVNGTWEPSAAQGPASVEEPTTPVCYSCGALEQPATYDSYGVSLRQIVDAHAQPHLYCSQCTTYCDACQRRIIRSECGSIYACNNNRCRFTCTRCARTLSSNNRVQYLVLAEEAQDTCDCGNCSYCDNDDSQDYYVPESQFDVCNNCSQHCMACDEYHPDNSLCLIGDSGFSCTCMYCSRRAYRGLRTLHQPDVIRGYSHRPVLLFCSLGERCPRPRAGTPYFGFELETEVKFGNRTALAYDVQQSWGDRVYIKSDGSLHNGFEIVSQPHTLEAAMEAFDWDAPRQWVRNGLRSFEYSSTGMHIHVSRDAFSASHLWRFIQLHYRNPTANKRIAGRRGSEYSSWRDSENERKNALKYAKGQERNMARYVPLNLQNSDTIELRYFKGTLMASSIRKNIQWAHACWAYTKELTTSQVREGALSWVVFREWIMDPKQREAGCYTDLQEFVEAKLPKGKHQDPEPSNGTWEPVRGIAQYHPTSTVRNTIPNVMGYDRYGDPIYERNAYTGRYVYGTTYGPREYNRHASTHATLYRQTAFGRTDARVSGPVEWSAERGFASIV